MTAAIRRRLAPLLLVAAGGTLCAASASASSGLEDAQGGSHDALGALLEALPDRVAAAVDEDRLASVSLAVVLEGDVVFCDAVGYADLEQKRPADPGTIYPIGSVTKVFTATMLARLSERRVVSLEDSLRIYLPEFTPSSPFPGSGPTTLRQLAAHTSGLPQDAPANFWCSFAGFSWLVTNGQTEMTWFVDCETLLAGLSDLEIVHQPEIRSHYSNLNVQLLGLALERACGEPFVTYVEREILRPLRMEDSGFTLGSEQRARLARGYVCTGPDAPMLAAPEYELGCAVYSGGLFSTAEDLARFLSWQLSGGSLTVVRVLRPGALRRMRTPQSIRRPPEYTSYGLGWAIVEIGGHDAIEHNGSLLGYHAHVSAVPDLDLGIVVLSNTKNYLWRPDACKDLAREILAELADTLEAARRERPFDPEAVDLRAYSGRYALPGGVASMDVAATANGLHVTLSDIPDFSEDFVPVGPHAFSFAVDPSRKPMLSFAPARDGAIESVTFLSYTFSREAADR